MRYARRFSVSLDGSRTFLEVHALEQRGQLTLFAEELNAGLVQRARILRAASCSFAVCKMPCSFSFIPILLWNVIL